jgi:hydroxymethylpyrimidine/phosphomethylpyrimidine kinase
MTAHPRILCIGGHDPTGGAGIQADIETVTALGGRAFSLVTCLTAQDTHDVAAILPTPPEAFARQAERLLGDIRVDAIKLGIQGSAEIIALVAELLQGFAGPVVLDPVLAAGGGFDLDGDRIAGLLVEHLLPHASLTTPNRGELRRLAGTVGERAAVRVLLDRGVDAVLVTGADEAEDDTVENVLHSRGASVKSWTWPRLPQRYHGSGCTLASACAWALAAGQPVEQAVQQAQAFTWQALERGRPVGHGQWLPCRRP